MLSELIIIFFPFVSLICCWFLYYGKRTIKPIPIQYVVFFVLVMAVCMGLYPVIEYSDKEKYLNFYRAILSNYYWGQYKDSGWQLFVTFCTKIFGREHDLFFLFVSLIYSFSYYFFAVHQFGKRNAGFFVLMAFGCLGFAGYGTNTVRSGMALGILLLTLSFEGKKYVKVLLALSAVTIHLSMAIPIIVFVMAKFINKNWCAYLLWGVCFVLSVLNFDLSSIIEEVMFVDNRIEKYSNMVNSSYESRYRIDFLLYSVVPIIIAYIYKIKRIKSSDLYEQVYRTYIITNAFWLLVIRMAYTNRIAYLSWMLIPYIVLYPVLNNKKNIRNQQGVVYKIMALFMIVNMVLSIRDMLTE